MPPLNTKHARARTPGTRTGLGRGSGRLTISGTTAGGRARGISVPDEATRRNATRRGRTQTPMRYTYIRVVQQQCRSLNLTIMMVNLSGGICSVMYRIIFVLMPAGISGRQKGLIYRGKRTNRAQAYV